MSRKGKANAEIKYVRKFIPITLLLLFASHCFILAQPAAPTSVTATPGSIWIGQTSNLNATSPGNSINWYDEASGGSLMGNVFSGVDFTVSPSTTFTYYAESQEPSTPIILEITDTPHFATDGVFFSISTGGTAIEIDGFPYKPHSGGNFTISVYYKEGDYSNYEKESGAWTKWGDFDTDGLEFIDITDFPIPTNTKYSFYFYCPASILQVNQGNINTSDATISIAAGSTSYGLFGDQVFYEYSFIAEVRYLLLGQTSTSRTPVTVSVQTGMTWNGSVNSNWDTPANWNSNMVPGEIFDVIIPDVGKVPTPVIAASGTATCHDLTIETGAVLNIQSTSDGTGSLITLGTISNNGTISIKRYLSESVWHLISAPNNYTTANIFLGDYLQTLAETTGVWSDISDPTVALIPVKGYGLWGTPGKATTYTFTGTPNSGIQDIGITHTNNNTEADGFNLVGNPYPSSIDWAGLDDTWGAVYYYNGTAYVQWNDGNGPGSQYVPPMQGFFVYTSTAGTFSLTNSDRTHAGAGTYYKASKTISNGLILEASNGSYNDELYILFDENTSEDFEIHHDAYKILSSTEGLSQLYSYTGKKMLSIDVRPKSEVIQLGFRNNTNGIYNIGIKDIAANSEAILEDTKTQTFHNLQNGNYQFAWNIEDDKKRFKLHLDAVGIDEGVSPQSNIVIFASGQEIHITGTEGKVLISDLLGRVVLEKNVYGKELSVISVNLNTGIYLVNIVNGDEVVSEKVFIN